MEPVTIHGECNMTRGHFHMDWDCAEFYFGISGTGLLLLMDEDGKAWAERVAPGSLHHIDGHLAHRLINTGVRFCAWGPAGPPRPGMITGPRKKCRSRAVCIRETGKSCGRKISNRWDI